MSHALRVALFFLSIIALTLINKTWFGGNMLATILGGAFMGELFRPLTKDAK